MGKSLLLVTLVVAILAGCGPETLAPGGAAQVAVAPAPDAASPTQEPGVSSPLPSPLPSPEATVAEPPTDTALPATPVVDLVLPSPTLIPTPDLEATTVPELDGIALVNIRPLLSPEGYPGVFPYSWSPDGTQFLGTVRSGESMKIGDAGYSVRDLVVGDAASGEIRFLRHNAGYPAWSRDGRHIYYLAARQDASGIFHDLYRQAADFEATPELIVQNVGDTGTEPAVQETADGQLLVSNQDYQPALVQFAGDTTSVVSLADLVGVETWGPAGKAACASLAADGHTALVISFNGTGYLIDLTSKVVFDTLEGLQPFCLEVTWSADSTKLVYTNDNGVFEYDLGTGETRTIVARSDLGFHEGATSAGFARPAWLPGEELLLFSAGTPEWDYVSGYFYYLFVVQRDGAYLRPLAPAFGRILAGDRSRVIVDTASWSTGSPPEHGYFLIDIVQP